MAALFVLSFATSYAALYDYALQLQFGREFAIVFPLVLDAVISVLAVTVLLERAIARRTVSVMGRQVSIHWPTWPLAALWIYFSGSVAGNVAHAPQLLAAQLVAAVPPISAALTFHLLLRLLDRAPALRVIAEAHEERAVEEQERAARRRARKAQLKTRTLQWSTRTDTHALSQTPKVSSHGKGTGTVIPHDRRRAVGRNSTVSGISMNSSKPHGGVPATDEDDLRRRVLAAVRSGDRVTGESVGEWLGVSGRTGRRRLARLLDEDPSLADTIEQFHTTGRK